jgi:hypothetical protein
MFEDNHINLWKSDCSICLYAKAVSLDHDIDLPLYVIKDVNNKMLLC